MPRQCNMVAAIRRAAGPPRVVACRRKPAVNAIVSRRRSSGATGASQPNMRIGETFMRRRFIAITIGLAFAAVIGAPVAQAQQPKRIPRVAYVYIFKEGPAAPFEQAFRQRLRELGWIYGQNVVVDVRDADGSDEKLSAIM